VLRQAFVDHPPPSYKGRRLKLSYATQAAGRGNDSQRTDETPTVVLFVNDTSLLHFSYRRYLEKRVRSRFGLIGNPLKLVLRAEEKRKARAR
jgi:GTP-binding protein